MLKYLELENFRSYKNNQGLIIAPITLIYGKNNAGKSNILNLLKALKQTRGSDAPFLLNGDLVKLSSYKDTVFDGKIEKKIKIGISSHRPYGLIDTKKTGSNIQDENYQETDTTVCFEYKFENKNLLFSALESNDIFLYPNKTKNYSKKKLIVRYEIEKIKKNDDKLKNILINKMKIVFKKEKTENVEGIINLLKEGFHETKCTTLIGDPDRWAPIWQCVFKDEQILSDFINILHLLNKVQSNTKLTTGEELYRAQQGELEGELKKIKEKVNQSFYYPKELIEQHLWRTKIEKCKNLDFKLYARKLENIRDLIKQGSKSEWPGESESVRDTTKEAFISFVVNDYKDNWEGYLFNRGPDYSISSISRKEYDKSFGLERGRNFRGFPTFALNARHTTFIQVAQSIFSEGGGCIKKETVKKLKDKYKMKEITFSTPENLMDYTLSNLDEIKQITNLRKENTWNRIFIHTGTNPSGSTFDPESLAKKISTFPPKRILELNNLLKNFDINYKIKIKNIDNEGLIFQIFLENEQTKIQTNICDVAEGIKKGILSLIVKTMSGGRQIILSEEIEQNLHPSLQAKIADFLVNYNFKKGHGNQFIIETHSEYLILRLIKLVKEKKINPLDLSINYIEMENGETKIHHLPIDNEGKFLMKWPDGFLPDANDEDM